MCDHFCHQIPISQSHQHHIYIRRNNIGNTKKGEGISHSIPCSTTSFENIHFQASSKRKAIADKLSKKVDTEQENEKSSEVDLNRESSEQDF